MALTLPDTEDLRFHMRHVDPWEGDEEEWADDALQRSADLLSMATGLEEDPEAELTFRTMTVAILAMAHAIFVTAGEDREALYAPYSSEHLGSYSYAKAMQAVQAKQDTGVPEFDAFVRWFLSLPNADGVSPAFQLTSENVFETPYSETDPTRPLVLSMDALNDEFGR